MFEQTIRNYDGRLVGYLADIAKAFVALGGRIYEHSSAGEFCDNPRAR